MYGKCCSTNNQSGCGESGNCSILTRLSLRLIVISYDLLAWPLTCSYTFMFDPTEKQIEFNYIRGWIQKS